MRISTLAATAALFATTAFLAVPPASADGAVPSVPTFSALDDSVAGHLTGTLTSPGAPYVRVSLGADDADSLITLTKDVDTFDLETWGYVGLTPLYVRACTSPDRFQGVCSEEVKAPQTFTAKDVVPTSVTWSQDTTVGPDTAMTVAVSDPGGGQLQAMQVIDGNLYSGRALGSGGGSIKPFESGSYTFELMRCGEARCIPYPQFTSPSYDVRLSLAASWPASAPPITSQQASSALNVQVPSGLVGATYDAGWYLTAYDVPGITAPQSVSNQPVPTSGILQLPFSGAAIPSEGHYAVTASISVHVPDFGAYPITFTNNQPTLRVDRSSAVKAFKPKDGFTTIYPNIRTADRPYRIWFLLIEDEKDSDELSVVKVHSGGADGPVVKTFPTVGGTSAPSVLWDARNDANQLVPSGTYTLTVADKYGNPGTATLTVRVDLRKRVLKTFTRTVTARASLEDSYVGRCSTLRRPASRGWAGSLGFYANTRCKTKSWNASAVSTLHAMKLPAADKYADLTVSAYGGAARNRRGSAAGLRVHDSKGSWAVEHRVPPSVGNHPMRLSRAESYIEPGRWFVWGFFTYAGGGYDVAKFTVTLHYYVLA